MNLLTRKHESGSALPNAALLQYETNIAKNTNDILKIKSDMESEKKRFDEITGSILEELVKLKSDTDALQKENSEKTLEIEGIKKLLEKSKSFLAYSEICTALNIANLDNTILKYYMYEQGIFDMKINKFHNTFKISKNYESSNCKLKKHIHIEGRTVLFKPSAIDYFNEHRKEIKETVSRYLRRLEQFNISRERVSSQHVKNYQEEICKICGIKNSYDADKWGKLYHVYEKNNPNYKKNYKLYREQYEKEHPDTTYIPSQLTYLVSICNSGDTLLKIACELFVD